MDTAFDICAAYAEQRETRTAATYALDLASLLNSTSLSLYLHGAAGVRPNLPLIATQSKAQEERILAAVRFRHGLAGDTPLTLRDGDLRFVHSRDLNENTIAVYQKMSPRREDINILTPYDETTVKGRTQGGLVVPFGDGNSGIRSAELALPLAKKLELPVTFYHSTWRSPLTDSPDPRHHMCAAARLVSERLQELADASGVQFQMHVELADDVVDGILKCAIAVPLDGQASQPANLIVMSRGASTVIGSYVDKALKLSSTPILTVSRPAPEEVQDE